MILWKLGGEGKKIIITRMTNNLINHFVSKIEEVKNYNYILQVGFFFFNLMVKNIFIWLRVDKSAYGSDDNLNTAKNLSMQATEQQMVVRKKYTVNCIPFQAKWFVKIGRKWSYFSLTYQFIPQQQKEPRKEVSAASL